MDEFDGPWKEAIEEWFENFLAFFFPPVHASIDWSRRFEFLDKELQQLAPESVSGTRTVDKLVKVFWKTGEEFWILIHVEVQAQADPHFARRMYVYRYRIDDKFNRPIVSLAVLADETANWRPNEYRESIADCELTFRFPTVKVLDFVDREEWLEAETNPFAVVTLTHLKTQQTAGDNEERRRWKVRLAKGLYRRGYNAQQVRRLFRLIDWFLRLPKELEQLAWREIEQFEKERQMPYVTSVEQIGMEKGMEKGILKGIRAVLAVRFGADGLKLMPEIELVKDASKLDRILEGLQNAASIEEARKLWL